MEEQRKAVRRMQDYINDHISEEITIGDLAKAASDAAAAKWKVKRGEKEALQFLAVQTESQDAETMRAHLVDGQPCPVCGVIHRKSASALPAVDLPPSSKVSQHQTP